MSQKKKIIVKTLQSKKLNKPDTITRAGITANLKFTRGKQLIEQNPFYLIPDPSNPRPGEIIDEIWLKNHLDIGELNSLCRISDETGEYNIPEFCQLGIEANDILEESYNFLRELAFSIRADGLIEPIEIFLADRENDPDYFEGTNLDYGYVILEGHQRRLAAMMAGVQTVTCIEITDESMLVKLKVKHRKLRRQLSENNLRKDLSVSQNFQIFQQLYSDPSVRLLTNKELALIIGLGEGIVSALKTICTRPENYPPIFFKKLHDNKLTFKIIRTIASKNYNEIERLLTESNNAQNEKNKKEVIARGRMGGAIKKHATFKVSDQNESNSLQRFLLSRFPEIEYNDGENYSYKTLESILSKIKEMAIKEEACPGALMD